MNNIEEIKISSLQNETLLNDFLNEDKELNITLEENSHLVYITYNLGNTNINNNRLIANLKKNSHLEIYNIVTSSKSNEIKQIINLNDVGANVQIMNLLLLTECSIVNSTIEIFHKSKITKSDLSNYVITKDKANSILNNNAKIEKNCSQSVAHQQTKGLTLSKEAKIKALPNLYIDEYDVIANHACSIGSINKEDLFYLMSRGMSQEEASKIIVMGYVQPILDHIKDEKLKAKIEQSFANYLLK